MPRRDATLPQPGEALLYDDDSRETRPPSLEAIPWLMLSHVQVMDLELDHREGFLLSLIDGRTTVELLIEIAAMPKRDVLRILARWLAMGVIVLK
jgi:hypothetical protein